MDLPELQIADILRYLGEEYNQESAPSLPLHTCNNYPTSARSSSSICPTALNKRMASPFKGSLDLLSYTTTMKPTRRGLLGMAVTPWEFVCALTTDFRWCSTTTLQNAGAAKQLSATLIKISTTLLTSKRSRHVSLLSVEHRLLAWTTDQWRGFTGGRTFQNTIHDVKRNKRSLARWQ
jgi:hypothetical protein